MTWLWIVVGLVAVVVVAARVVWVRSERRLARQFIEDHQRAFPGACPVCSMHRYGLREGHEKPGSRPAPHWCPELRSDDTSAI